MPLLISKADFAGRIPLPANLDSATKLEQHILHAQDFDLRGLMGDKLYYDFLNKYQDAPYVDFLAGKTYDNDGINYTYEGLKPVLVYFAGARLVKELDMHITPNGIMNKRNDFSDPVELKEKIFRANQYENTAIAYWNMAKTYLDFYSSDFEYWNNGCIEQKSGFKPRMTAVGYGRL
ncbi:MAG: hypothetical protein K0S09_12 [Sphingobacteriaceae bacterium]|jgi:hypothetical protein|nr:hypothetical protein [Sphingobacteriaceae bacterium]